MTPNPVALEKDDVLAWALHRMGVDGYRHLPVLDGERLAGFLDVVRLQLRHHGRAAELKRAVGARAGGLDELDDGADADQPGADVPVAGGPDTQGQEEPGAVEIKANASPTGHVLRHLQLIEVMGAMGMREARRLRGDVGRAMFYEELEEQTDFVMDENDTGSLADLIGDDEDGFFDDDE